MRPNVRAIVSALNRRRWLTKPPDSVLGQRDVAVSRAATAIAPSAPSGAEARPRARVRQAWLSAYREVARSA